jgi:hypothetical protein
VISCSACGKTYGETGHSCGDTIGTRAVRAEFERHLKSYRQLQQQLLEQRKYVIPLSKQLQAINQH